MLPDEEENQQIIAELHKAEFEAARDLMDAGLTVLNALSRQRPESLTTTPWVFLVATLTRELRRLRSCIALSALGMSENCDILTRSLFEALLSVRFVLGRTIPADEISENLKAAIRGLPPVPPGRDLVEFRVDVYRALEPLRFWQISEDYHDQMDGVAEKIAIFDKEVDKVLGPEWVKRLARKGAHYSGLSISQAAEFHGLGEYYKTLYSLQCARSHVNDAFKYVAPRNDGSAGWHLFLTGESKQTALSLTAAMGVFGMLLDEINGAAFLELKSRLAQSAALVERLPGATPHAKSHGNALQDENAN
jgi:hypothetical protein